MDPEDSKEHHNNVLQTHCAPQVPLLLLQDSFYARAHFLFYLQNYLLRDQALPIGNMNCLFICLFI